MAKRNLLLVDADPRSLRVLEVSLRKAGYSVTTCGQVDQAIELLELSEPDMIIADTRLPGKDGFALVSEMRARPQLAQIPLMFLSSDPSVESKVRGLELGIEDYLAKPVYIREILARVNLVMERKEREGLGRTAKTRFAGSLEDMGLVDLLQTIDLSRKSGVLKLSSGPRRGTVLFMEGRVVDAELGKLVGEAAIYRFLLWNEGRFELEFGEVRSEDKLGISTQALLMEGVRRLDEWGRLQEQLPGLMSVLELDHGEVMHRLDEIPDELNTVLRAFDGQRDLAEVLEVSGGDDLVTLMAISKLFFDGFLRVRHRTDPSADAQVGSHSDPFIGLMPSESELPPSLSEPVVPGPSRGAVSSLPVHFREQEREPIQADAVRTSSSPPRVGNGEPVLAAGRVALAVVQLKRVPAISIGSGGVGSGASSLGTSPSALESEDDMKQRGKRRAERDEQRGNGNVIPLHAGLRDGGPQGTSAHDERVERSHGERSTEQLKSARPDPRSSSERVSDYPPGELHHDDDTGIRDFFAKAPKSIAPSGEPWLDFDDAEHEAAHPTPHHRGMYWTLGIMGAGLLMIGLFLLYNKVLMPTPEDFAIRRPVALPTPELLKSLQATPQAKPVADEPVARPAPAVAAEPVAAEPVAAEPVAPEPVAAEPVAAATTAPALAATAVAVTTPNNVAVTGPANYAALVADARKLGFRKPAEETYLKAVELNPAGFEAISGLAMLYLNQGKNQQAKERAQQALALNQSNDEAWIVLGAAESALGKERLARDAYVQCAALPTGKYVAECKRLLR
ncbi:MAG: response regulator receiver [Myxococcaceae bacterium]|nr:response regulator receiver [Myxococcaceae bacterium]